MQCTRCGRESPEGSAQCIHCGGPLVARPAPVRARTSGMAVASLVLGILGFFLFAIPALVGLVLGIISLRAVNRSQGRLRGQGLAIAGICVSGCVTMLIPIMAAMVFPVFARARESARKAVCLSNIKNVCLALQMYAGDNGGVYPDGRSWSDALAGYVPNKAAFVCPSQRQRDAPCGYALNQEISGAATASIRDPQGTIALFESDRGWNAVGGWDLLTARPRHLGGDSFGYLDGHSDWVVREPSSQ